MERLQKYLNCVHDNTYGLAPINNDGGTRNFSQGLNYTSTEHKGCKLVKTTLTIPK